MLWSSRLTDVFMEHLRLERPATIVLHAKHRLLFEFELIFSDNGTDCNFATVIVNMNEADYK